MKNTPAGVRVAILLPDQVWAGSVHLARELLLVAGTLLAHSRDARSSALFDIQLVGANRSSVTSFGGTTLRPDAVVGRCGNFQVVVVPTQFAPEGEMSNTDRVLAPWIAAQHQAGALVVSLSGAVLLAKSGLLDGKQATGVRSEAAVLARHFPQVRFTPSRQIVVNDQIICAGGIAPTADVCAQIVQRFHGRRAAQKLVRYATGAMLPSQEQLAVWSVQYRQHKDRHVLAAQEALERDIAQSPSLAQLAARAALSERALSRRFAAAVGMNLRQYAHTCRLELAQALLRTTRDPLTAIADGCGYASTSALVHAFGVRHGISPLHYREQASKAG
jgi:transcriptional regulator GlxA family with amidase domain